MHRLIIEHIVKQVLKEARSISATTKAKQKLLSSEEGAKLINITTPGRVGNPGDITDQQFKDILKSVFKLDDTDIKTVAPGIGGISSKFTAYTFPYEGSEATIVLAGKGKESSERQERSLIDVIKSVDGIKTLVFNNTKIEGVKSAEKIGKVDDYKAQAYADIKLETTKGIKKISAKGLQAPSLGGGGLLGLDTLNNSTVNTFVEQFYNEVASEYEAIIKANPELEGHDLQNSKLIKDVYKEIPKEVEIPMLKGSKNMGGPVDYIYVGDMDVDYIVEGSTITFKGSLYTIEEFTKQGTPFYVRLLKREGPCYFTNELNTGLKNIKVPKIFSFKPNGEGRTQSRLFITNRATKKLDYKS